MSQDRSEIPGYTEDLISTRPEDSNTPAFPTPTNIVTDAERTTSSPAPVVPQATRPNVPHSQEEQDEITDPQVIALRGMFPDYDNALLATILESVGRDQDRAIDALLGMSDPEYKPDVSVQSEPFHPQSQEELDEQLARRLLLEDQQQQQERWERRHAQPERRNSGNRQSLQQQSPNPQGQPGSGDTMIEIQEQFNKFAETGKKTVATLFSKVKAKIQEFDQARNGPAGQNPPQNPQQTWGSSQAPYQRQQGQQPSYYDPRQSPSPPPEISLGAYPVHQAAATTNATTMAPSPPAPAQGYDVTPNPVSASTASPARQSQTGSGRATPIDGGKLGLLPKRPVALMPEPAVGSRSQSQPQQQRLLDDDDDGLEYAENPFEEDKK